MLSKQFERKQLRKSHLSVSPVIILVCFAPIVILNAKRKIPLHLLFDLKVSSGAVQDNSVQ